MPRQLRREPGRPCGAGAMFPRHVAINPNVAPTSYWLDSSTALIVDDLRLSRTLVLWGSRAEVEAATAIFGHGTTLPSRIDETLGRVLWPGSAILQ